MKNYLKQLFQNSNADGKSPKKSSYILVIGLIGLLLLIIGNIFTSTEEAEDTPMAEDSAREKVEDKPPDESINNQPSDEELNMSEVEDSYEEDLQYMLDKIEGVSESEVMVNLNSSRVKVFEKDLINNKQVTKETDDNGGTRDIEDTQEETEVVLVNQGDKEVPLLVRTEKPGVRGVFIVAEGVDHATVEEWVVDSVSRVLDVPTHKVSVMPK